MKIIRAKQGNTALLKDGEIPIIGYYDDHRFIMKTDGSRLQCTVVNFDPEMNGKSDIFIFCQRSLVAATIHAERETIFGLEVANLLNDLDSSADFVKKYVELYLIYALAGKIGS